MSGSSHLPDDENGDVLRRMVESGDDLAQPRDIDFFFLFPTFAQAGAFAAEAAALDDVDVGLAEPDDESEAEVCVARHMAPTHAGITAFEAQLTAMAQRHDGEADGWGCEQVDRLH